MSGSSCLRACYRLRLAQYSRKTKTLWVARVGIFSKFTRNYIESIVEFIIVYKHRSHIVVVFENICISKEIGVFFLRLLCISLQYILLYHILNTIYVYIYIPRFRSNWNFSSSSVESHFLRNSLHASTFLTLIPSILGSFCSDPPQIYMYASTISYNKKLPIFFWFQTPIKWSAITIAIVNCTRLRIQFSCNFAIDTFTFPTF